VRLRCHRVGALAHVPHGRPLLDDRAANHVDRAELEQGHRIAVGGLDRQSATAVRNRAYERDRAGYRRDDLRADLCADVDAAVLPAGVGIAPERERTDDRTVDRPGPGTRGRDRDERREGDRGGEGATHAPPAFVCGGELPSTLAASLSRFATTLDTKCYERVTRAAKRRLPPASSAHRLPRAPSPPRARRSPRPSRHPRQSPA